MGTLVCVLWVGILTSWKNQETKVVVDNLSKIPRYWVYSPNPPSEYKSTRCELHAPVSWICIDIHHGDGVQEAFYLTDRVMTVSFHKFGNMFFPGTGDMYEYGIASGRYYSLNVPLKDGIDDTTYLALFKPVMEGVISKYRPSVIVLQCGADSLAMDRLGVFCLNIKGHGECVRFMKSFGIPMLVLGGGGYTIRNVSRCWTYETALLLDETVEDKLPTKTDYYEFFAPDYSLCPTHQGGFNNQNTKAYMESIKMTVFDHLQFIDNAPSVQMHPVPPDIFSFEDENEDETKEEEDKEGEVGVKNELKEEKNVDCTVPTSTQNVANKTLTSATTTTTDTAAVTSVSSADTSTTVS